jgi:hypothetical protein
VKLGMGVDERCELNRLELDPVTLLNTFENFRRTFFIPEIIVPKHDQNSEGLRES